MNQRHFIDSEHVKFEDKNGLADNELIVQPRADLFFIYIWNVIHKRFLFD